MATEKSEKFSPKDFLNGLKLHSESDISASLQKFIAQIENFNNSISKDDVILEFLNSTAKTGRYVQLLITIDKVKKVQPRDISLVFAILEYIFLRIRDDLQQYSSVGNVIVQYLCKHCMDKIYFMLGQGKSHHVKKTLKMLTTFVVFNNQTASEILTHFNFLAQSVKKLPFRTDMKDEQSIRVCYIHFLLSFLFTDDDNITKLLDNSDLFKIIFVHLHMDNYSTIKLFLSTLVDKVFKNKALSKTLKVRIVNGKTLYYVAKLYAWIGKLKWDFEKSKDKSKKKEFVVEPIRNEELKEEQELVCEVTNQFLLAICCSHKEGIIFQDLTLGTAKNSNHLITNLLSCIKKPYMSSYTTDLCVQILSSVPDQLRFFTAAFESVMTPRPSDQWLALMKFLIKVYDGQNVGQFLEKLGANASTKDIVYFSCTLLFPKMITHDVIRQGLKHTSVMVNRAMLQYICHLAQRLSKFCSLLKTFELSQPKFFGTSSVDDILEGVGKSAAKVLLEAKEMDELWENMKNNKQENMSRIVELELILNIQMTLKQSFPFMMEQSTLDLVDILINGQDLSSDLTSAEFADFQLKAVELLILTESKRVVCGPIIEMLINIVTEQGLDRKFRAVDLLIKMFIKSNLFSNSEEIHIWFNNFLCCTENCKVIGKFLHATLLKLIDMNQKNGVKESIKSSDTVTCMLVPALKVLRSQEIFANDANCQTFLTSVLRDVYHTETDKKFITNFFEAKKSLLPENFSRYMKVCSLNGGKKKLSENKIEKSKSIVKSLTQLMKFRKVKCILLKEKDIIENMKNLQEFDQRRLTNQILCYLDIILSENNPNGSEIVEYFFKLLHYLIFPTEAGTFQKSLCSIVISHPIIKKCFFNYDFEFASNLLLNFLSLIIDSDHDVQHFSWYINEITVFVKNLANFDKKINSHMKEFIVNNFKHITNEDVLHVFESLSETVLTKYNWLTKIFCQRISNIISADRSFGLSNASVENLLGNINSKSIASGVLKLIKAFPAYCYCFKPGALKNYLVENQQHAIKVLCYALSQSSFVRKEFEDLCQAEELQDINRESFSLLFEVYLENYKCLSMEKQSITPEKLSSVVETLESNGILNVNKQTIDIYLNLIVLNIRDLKCAKTIIHAEIFESEDDKDLDRIKTLSKITDDRAIWDSLMKKCFNCLEENLCSHFLRSLLVIQEKVKDFASEYISLNWEEFIKNILQISLRDVEKSTFLEFLLEFVMKYNIYVDCTIIAEMIFGHSNCLTVLLSSNNSNAPYFKTKEILVDILVALTSRDSKIITSSHIPLLLASYNATLSLTDEKILYLLHVLSTNGVNFDEYRPFMWGRAAIEFYAVRRSASFTLNEMPNVQSVLKHFDKELLTTTAMNFPIDLDLQPKITENSTDRSILDPRFLFPLLSTLLSPNCFVNCSEFLECNVLPVVLASLSSNCSEMRKAGYYILTLFYEHLESAKYKKKVIWLHLLTAIKNGIDEENLKLPNVISVYLAKITPLLVHADDPLQEIVSSFLLLKSDLDMNHVPDFIKLFSGSQHSRHRKWIIQLLIDGVKDVNDYYICEKRFLSKIILSFCESAVCKVETTFQILHLLLAFAVIPTAARRFITFGGVLSYLNRILVKYGLIKFEIVSDTIHLLNKLWFTMINNQETELIDDNGSPSLLNRSKLLSSAIVMEFHLVCNICVDLIGVKSTLNDWEIITATLASVYHHINSRSDMKFYNTIIASTVRVDDFLKIHKTVMEKTKTDDQHLTDVKSRCFDKSAVNKIILQLCSWIVENNSFKINPISFCQTCFNVIEYVFASTYFEESFVFQMDFLKFIEKLFAIEVLEHILKRTSQTDKILNYLLQFYSICNPYPGELTSESKFKLLIQLNKVTGIILMEARCNISMWIVESSETDIATWTRAIDCYVALLQHKSALSVSTQNYLTILSCEFLLHKTNPLEFDSLTHSSELMCKLRKRCHEKSDTDNKVKRKKRQSFN